MKAGFKNGLFSDSSQTPSTEALLEDKTVINKSALGQMMYCCRVDKYLEIYPLLGPRLCTSSYCEGC